ncbi:MAG: hypothetical protein M5R42_09345 [Rhodocyclaceae bacterium]|nr:hypothetical protein [Rhodocyclaceae bacterium]
MASQAYDKALQIDSSNASAQSKLALIRDLMGASTRPSTLASRSTSGKVPSPAAPAQKPEVAPVAKAESAAAAKSEPAPSARPSEPQAASAAEPKQNVNSEAEVENAIRDWAKAWSGKTSRPILPHMRLTSRRRVAKQRSAWEAGRTRRIDKPGAIQVTIENMQITVEGDEAKAKFRQLYKSGKFKSTATKSLVLVKRDGKWLIQQEQVSN